MAITKSKIRSIYKYRAKRYDRTSKIYQLIGLNTEEYRIRAIQRLNLRRGDRVVDLGCGTGMNFPLLVDEIGTEGRLIGVDFSREMLARAKDKIRKNHWKNVTLVQSDIDRYAFPKELNAVLSTNVFGFISESDEVIRRASKALIPDGRMVIQDGKRPENWPVWLFRFAVLLGLPYGITTAFYTSQPWKSLKRFFQRSGMEEMYFGMQYISYGVKAGPNGPGRSPSLDSKKI